MNIWDHPNKKSSACVHITLSNLTLLCQMNTEGSNLQAVTPTDNNLFLSLTYHNREVSVSPWTVAFNLFTLLP